jgi:hypothetical protein
MKGNAEQQIHRKRVLHYSEGTKVKRLSSERLKRQRVREV